VPLPLYESAQITFSLARKALSPKAFQQISAYLPRIAAAWLAADASSLLGEQVDDPRWTPTEWFHLRGTSSSVAAA
jgi:hypothetical protein